MKRGPVLLTAGLLLAGLAMVVAVYAGNNKTITGSKNYITHSYDNVHDFNKIQLAGSFDIEYTQKASDPFVSIHCPENLLQYVELSTSGGTLRVGFKKGVNIRTHKGITIKANSSRLNDVSVAGSGDVKLKSNLDTSDFQIRVAGSGDFEAWNITCTNVVASVAGSGDIDIDRLLCNRGSFKVAGSGDIDVESIDAVSVNASVAGSGDLSLSGEVESAEFSVAGSGDIEAEDLIANKVKASVSGSGTISCYASQDLEAKRSGSGTIYYYGDPQNVLFQGKGLVKK